VEVVVMEDDEEEVSINHNLWVQNKLTHNSRNPVMTWITINAV
jgi:hypothetical protein